MRLVRVFFLMMLVSNVNAEVNKELENPNPLDVENSSDNDQLQKKATEDRAEKNLALRRRIAEISQEIEIQNKLPKKIFITPSTLVPVYSEYYKLVVKRIENVGVSHFPQKNGEKLYGDLIVFIPILPSGKINEGNGGPTVEKSSGNLDLDKAALNIVRLAAPFKEFSKKMRAVSKGISVIAATRFNFIRDPSADTELLNESK